MMKPRDRDATRSAAASMGWHVHYAVDGHVRVQLACDREAAIDMARAHLSENHEVLRLIRYDAREVVVGTAIKNACTKHHDGKRSD